MLKICECFCKCSANGFYSAGAGGAASSYEFGQTNNDTAGILAMKSSLEGFERSYSWTLWSVQMMHYYRGYPGIEERECPPPNFASVLKRPYVNICMGD